MAGFRCIRDNKTKRDFQKFIKQHPEYRFGQALTVFLNEIYGHDIHYVYMSETPQDDNSELEDIFYTEFDKESK